MCGDKKKMTEVKYGRILRNDKIVGYCTYTEEGVKVEIFSEPYKNLEVKINGENVQPNYQHVMVWTKVAGWLGQDQILSFLKNVARDSRRWR